MTTATITRTDLIADSKLVYNANNTTLLELAEKYNVTTRTLLFHRQNPTARGTRSLAVAVLGTKSTKSEMQRKLYATIKSLIREMDGK